MFNVTAKKTFLSTPSARRATRPGLQAVQDSVISIHALREEGDDTVTETAVTVGTISIHALREEGDAACQLFKVLLYLFLSTPSARRATLDDRAGVGQVGVFLSTPSARRATGRKCGSLHRRHISIHALREEGDVKTGYQRTAILYFYPRPPRGGRQSSRERTGRQELFLSTPSARRATQKN